LFKSDSAIGVTYSCEKRTQQQQTARLPASPQPRRLTTLQRVAGNDLLDDIIGRRGCSRMFERRGVTSPATPLCCT